MQHLTTAELEAALDHLRNSPRDAGRLELIVRRPAVDERELLTWAELTETDGLVGDNWSLAPNPDRDNQINIMNARVAALVAQDPARRALAGDQLYIDFDLSEDNTPPGTQLAIGDAVLEVTPPPHTGCQKFAARFGTDATKFVNSPEGKRRHFRGVNARVVRGGVVHTGDFVRKLQ
jgi:MOSC domain-containing protein YiiM